MVVFIISYLGEKAKDKAVEYASRLRREGMAAILASSRKSLKAQLKQANSLGAAYAIIIGEDEVRSGTVVLRDMAKGEQRSIPAEDMVDFLKVR